MAYKFNARMLGDTIAAARTERFTEVVRRTPARSITTKAPLSLRDAAEEIGISGATLSRIERGWKPDIDTFALICTWLKKDPSTYFKQDSRRHPSKKKTDRS